MDFTRRMSNHVSELHLSMVVTSNPTSPRTPSTSHNSNTNPFNTLRYEHSDSFNKSATAIATSLPAREPSAIGIHHSSLT